MNRRTFLQFSGVAAVGVALPSVLPTSPHLVAPCDHPVTRRLEDMRAIECCRCGDRLTDQDNFRWYLTTSAGVEKPPYDPWFRWRNT